MTLKYESEILFDLMKRDGDDAPSDVLPYESELKEKYLQQVEGAYPKLQDYRSEWLNYNLNAHLPADFPVESVSNVTNATFENVVPYEYKSAILSGQTLVNTITNVEGQYSWVTVDNVTFTHVKDSADFSFINYNCSLKPNTKYFIRFEYDYVSNENLRLQFGFRTNLGGWDSYGITSTKGINKATLTTNGTSNNLSVIIMSGQTLESASFGKLMIIEYQEGMENWVIPYFEGMQSVKMPVLTTSNEDGTKTIILTVNEDVDLGGVGGVKDELDLTTGELTENTFELTFNGSENWKMYTFEGQSTKRFRLALNHRKTRNDVPSVICDKIMATPNNQWNQDMELIEADGTLVSIRKNIDTLKEFTEWLRVNNIVCRFLKKQPSIKTVDLTVTNQDGTTLSTIKPIEGTMHVSTSSQTLPPLLDMSVPVEATSQNLMSFANIEEEE